MIDLGSELREAREAKGISLAEAETHTRIKERYLKALESNDWMSLPTPVQARGFLRNYAIYLGLDEEHIMASFGQAIKNTPIAVSHVPGVEPAVRTADPNGAVFEPRDIEIERATTIPGWLNSDVVLGVVLALVVALVGFAILRFATGEEGSESSSAQTTPVATPGAPQPTGVQSPGQATPAAVTPTFDTSTGGVQLSLEATEHVWVRVTVDGSPVLEGILAPGAPQTWQGSQQILLETANGAGLKAVVNGQPQGPLGERGQPLVLAWGPNGLMPITPPANP